MTQLSNPILKECIQAFSEARGRIIDAIEVLWKVNQSEAWKGEYENFGEFCEDGLKISRSTGSQYVAIYGRYINEGNLSVKTLREVDPAKLYAALKLKGNPEQQFSKALTLTRRELKEDRNDEQPHDHEPITICRVCHIQL